MVRETDIEYLCFELADRMGWSAFKGDGPPGAPDKIFLKEGLGFTAEIKRKGNKQQSNQIIQECNLTYRGVPYYLIYTLEQFKDAILIEEIKLTKFRNLKL